MPDWFYFTSLSASQTPQIREFCRYLRRVNEYKLKNIHILPLKYTSFYMNQAAQNKEKPSIKNAIACSEIKQNKNRSQSIMSPGLMKLLCFLIIIKVGRTPPTLKYFLAWFSSFCFSHPHFAKLILLTLLLIDGYYI